MNERSKPHSHRDGWELMTWFLTRQLCEICGHQQEVICPLEAILRESGCTCEACDGMSAEVVEILHRVPMKPVLVEIESDELLEQLRVRHWQQAHPRFQGH